MRLSKTDLRLEVTELRRRVQALECAIGFAGSKWTGVQYDNFGHVKMDEHGRVICNPNIANQLEAIKNHIGIEVVENPEPPTKWIAQKVRKGGAK